MDISVVLPTYNEEKNVFILYNRLKKVLEALNADFEIIYIDDGSRDKTFRNLIELNKKDLRVKIIKFRKNFGQTAAMSAGFEHAKGDIVISMDADLQNDPSDIPKLISKLHRGYDVVSGWRYNRKDPLSKKIPSLFANFLRKGLTGEKIHDSGCSLKAYKNETLKNLNLYGEMHRFIPTLIRWKGYRIGEIKVHHHHRKYGKTKYNFTRLFRGFLDLLTARFLHNYAKKPLHFFAKLSFILFSFGFFILLYNFTRYGFNLNVGPTLLASVLFILVGVQFFGFGFLSELLAKLYYSSNKREIYNIERVIG
ncbi:glycosyltransferase family 2 protein [Candidatus Woesearchaeota archaeon]|nr:glycosyltransferase family 2 protein [Candidatus Woesearchaeota archaeon]